MALIVLLLAAPILLVKLPWFIPTINALQNTIAELAIDGTPSYIEEKSGRLQRGMFALGLYVFGFIAVIGLIGIATNLIRRKILLLAIWFAVIVVSSGLVIFEFPAVGSDTDRVYVAIFVMLPIVVALVAACAFVISVKNSSSSAHVNHTVSDKLSPPF
jgi:hypothetical protein